MSVYTPLEWIFTRLKLALLFSIALSTPLFLYELFRFAARGLYQNEKRFFIKIVPFSFVLFILGTVIAYFLVVPVIFKYIILYSSDVAVAQISVQKTMSVVTTFVLGLGLVFQLSLIAIFLIKMGIVKYETLKKKRILIYAAIASFTMLLSPDPTFVAQLISGILLIVLFEFILVIAKLF